MTERGDNTKGDAQRGLKSGACQVDYAGVTSQSPALADGVSGGADLACATLEVSQVCRTRSS
jgi:hypothetical protein